MTYKIIIQLITKYPLNARSSPINLVYKFVLSWIHSLKVYLLERENTRCTNLFNASASYSLAVTTQKNIQ